MAESSRLLSSDKGKSKHSNLVGVAIYWTNFKAEWKKKNLLSSQECQMMLPVGDIIKTSY